MKKYYEVTITKYTTVCVYAADEEIASDIAQEKVWEMDCWENEFDTRELNSETSKDEIESFRQHGKLFNED